jgi:hypothetical protein
MEIVTNEVPLELPSIKYTIIPIKTNKVPIIQKYNASNVSNEIFDPSAFANTPPNDFFKFLKHRIEHY